MANHTKTDPKGIDQPIQRLQTFLYNNLGWLNKEIYGRVYKGNNEGVVPQPYLESGEYLKDAFFKDKANNMANIFFVDADKHTTKDQINFNAEVKIVFMVNLKKLFPDVEHRADEECHDHVYNLIRQKKAFKFIRLEKTLKVVLEGFSQDTVQKLDIEPYHTFAMVGTINYNFINC